MIKPYYLRKIIEAYTAIIFIQRQKVIFLTIQVVVYTESDDVLSTLTPIKLSLKDSLPLSSFYRRLPYLSNCLEMPGPYANRRTSELRS